MRLHGHARYHADAAAEAERHYFDVLSKIMQVVEARDKTTAGRSERMSRLVGQIARHLDLGDRRAALLGMVAQLQDIGLLAVPDSVLQQRGGLAGAESRSVQLHPEISYQILRPLSFLDSVLEAVKYHHERLNGTGYPAGVRRERIPVEAQILAVAETFEAMTHDRPYRRAISPAQAVAELVRCADVGFDRDCVVAVARAVNMAHLLPSEWAVQPNAPAGADGAKEVQPASAG